MKEQGNHNLEHYIIKTILYYDVFNYPLTTEEIYRFLQTNSVSKDDVSAALTKLADKQQVFRFREFYTVRREAELIERRVRGNQRAEDFLKIARRKARIISRFPFVRAVMASGSLSKGYMDEKSDLDFFVVTHPGRLWIARMLLVLYKKLFLFNSHKYFCINYYVDTDHLEIEEKNIFTATELATVIPLYGADYYHALIARNAWVKIFFPNFKMRPVNDIPNHRTGTVKKIMEKFIDLVGGEQLNNFFLRLNTRRTERLYRKQFNENDFKVAFKTKEHVSKNHPNHYQRKVIERYSQKLIDFSDKHAIELI